MASDDPYWASSALRPHVGLDLNDGFGFHSHPKGVIESVDSPALGPHGRAVQRYAANKVFELAERFALRTITTDFAIGPTFHGTKSATHIVFQLQTPSAQQIVPFKRKNMRLELLVRPGLQDHAPV